MINLYRLIVLVSKYPLKTFHYLTYLTFKTFKGGGLAILNIIYFLYFLELSGPFAYYFSSGIPLYVSCVFSVILAFYNDFVYNSEIIEVIEDRFDKLKMSYPLILIQFLVFLFFPFVILISLIKM